MTHDPDRTVVDRNEEVPDRVAHRRKIAERLAPDNREYAADDPSRIGESQPRSRLPRIGGPGSTSDTNCRQQSWRPNACAAETQDVMPSSTSCDAPMAL
jgi:hypothetical protein